MRLLRAALPIVASVLAWMTVASEASAQGNYRSTPVGGRTTLVGGTGVVYGSDGAAAFLNPATVVRVDPGRLTFSVNFYSISVLQAPRWYTPGEIDKDRFGDVPRDGASMTSAAFHALPSSLCIFLRASDISAKHTPRRTEVSLIAGQRLAVTSYQLPPTLAQTSYGAFSAVFVIAGSTSLNAIKRAVKDVKNVLDPDNRKK